MPLVVPSYISRFRTHSQSTATSANTSSESRSIDPPTDTSITTNNSLYPIVELDQKAHPSSHTSFEEMPSELNLEEHTVPLPPRRKARSATHLTVKSQGDMSMEQDSINADAASPPSSPRSPLLSRILSTPLLGGARGQSTSSPEFEKEDPMADEGQTSWATFGRRLPGMPRLSEFGAFRGRESSSKSSSKRSNQASGSHQQSHTQPLEFQSASPVGTLSSSSGSRSHSRRHATQHSDHVEPESSQDHSISYITSHSHTEPATPKPSRPFPDGVSNTFGRGGSRRPQITAEESGINDAFFTPPRTSTPPPPERLARRSPPGTYPQRARKGSLPTVGSVSFPTLPRRSSKSSMSRTRAEEVFLPHHRSVSNGEDLQSVSVQRNEIDSIRRPSADLFGSQAVSQDDSSDSSWVAGVNREIVRLSLALSEVGGSQVQLPADIEEARREQERAELGAVPDDEGADKNPTLFGSVGQDRKAFLRAARRKTGPSIMQTVSADDSSQPSGSSATTASRRAVARVSPAATRPLSSFNTRMQSFSDPGPSTSAGEIGDIFDPPTNAGKRKMTESQEDVTLKEPKGILVHKRDSKIPSDASHAPSSYRLPKRIRLSTPGPGGPSTSTSRPHSPPSRPSSSLRSHNSPSPNPRRVSQSSLASSIPVRAIVSPRAPSLSSAGTSYHMRDPTLAPSRRHSTQWTGAARRRWGDQDWRGPDGAGGRNGVFFPIQGWAFVLGFVLFPLWWIAALGPVRWKSNAREQVQSQDGRGLPLWDTAEEKAARETVEYDVAYTWRRRCRIMSIFGLLLYVPLVVLLAVLVPRAV
ncbi:hypothetical protein M422DRAFT_238482 [Sphaerobolus stellatus SS14]|nr:hypothetical protein M422DRAFT_238482 [Sphaerobolus stellatus SS14]